MKTFVKEVRQLARASAASTSLAGPQKAPAFGNNRSAGIAQRRMQQTIAGSALVQRQQAQRTALTVAQQAKQLMAPAARGSQLIAQRQVSQLPGRGVIQAKGIHFNVGVGNLWHVHKDHVKFANDNSSRINFEGRSKTYIKRQMELYHNTLPHSANAHTTYLNCRQWITKHL